MNKRRQDKLMHTMGIQSWSEIETVGQFRTFLSCLCDMEKDAATFILPQIQRLRELSDQYFDEAGYRIVNYEPQIMFEFEGARGLINGMMDAAKINYARLAETYTTLCMWVQADSSVLVETPQGSSSYSIAEAMSMVETLEFLHEKDGGEDTDERIHMTYEGAMTELWMSNEQDGVSGDLDLDIEEILERALQQGDWGEDQSDLNSRLN